MWVKLRQDNGTFVNKDCVSWNTVIFDIFYEIIICHLKISSKACGLATSIWRLKCFFFSLQVTVTLLYCTDKPIPFPFLVTSQTVQYNG